jgi:hypothetical protein
MNPDNKYLDEFFKAIEASLPGYSHGYFSYLALKDGEEFVLSQGQLMLNTMPALIPPRHFRSENIRAGFIRIADLGLDAKSMTKKLLSGALPTPHGDLKFRPGHDGHHSIYFSSFHSDGVPQQSRQMFLYIRGDRRPQLLMPKLDWELRSAKMPFDGLLDLCRDMTLSLENGDRSEVTVIAPNVAVISDESVLEQTQAKLVIRLAHGLNQSNASIGIRIVEKQNVTKRYTIEGTRISWKGNDGFQRGEVTEAIPSGAVLLCIACYAGEAQHYWWVSDPKAAPNPFRVIHNAFDPNLNVLRDLTQKSNFRGGNARDLEIAVEWLLWLLGYSPTHIGGPSRMSEAPDLIATTPQGNILVVECTTGILKEDNKLAHVVERTEIVRKSLAMSGNQHLKVLPVIATTKTREEVRADLAQAQNLGVLVLTKEDLVNLTERTITFPDANNSFVEAEESLRRLTSEVEGQV